jgi:hypothetical protein
MPQYLKSTFASGQPIASLPASWLNFVANWFNSIEGIGCHFDNRSSSGEGWKLVVDDNVSDWELYGFEFEGATQIKIKERSIWLHTIGECAIDEQTVNLSGDPCWVVARVVRGTTTAAIMCQATAPASDGSYLYIALYKFSLVSTSSGPTYDLVMDSKFDINIDAPMR